MPFLTNFLWVWKRIALRLRFLLRLIQNDVAPGGSGSTALIDGQYHPHALQQNS
jgi:hypothetical protein